MSNRSYALALSEISKAFKNKSKVLDLSNFYVEGELRPPRHEEKSMSLRYANKLILENLPKEIGKLKNLEMLILDGLGLINIPPEIGNLKKLKVLKASKNEIESLPPEFFELNNLVELDLSFNQIKKIDKSLSKLQNLECLNLSFNKLSILPSQIGSLANLNIFDASSNILEEIPFELTKLKQLNVLNLMNNRTSIPEEILKHDSKKIQSYLKDLTYKNRKPLREAKLIFIGNGFVGKTSLIKMLTKNSFNPDEERTSGISITPWSIYNDNKKFNLNIWDFGGQEIMHATHKFFMTKRSIYVLVINPRIEDNHGESDLEYWIKLIRSYAPNVPIIIVTNKCETHPIDIEKNTLSKKYPEIIGFIETSCVLNTGIDRLKSKIYEALRVLEHIEDQLPKSYFDIKETLVRINKDYIQYQDYENICRTNSPDMDEISRETLVGLLHDLGIMLNFREDRLLRETQVLNPEWVTNGVYQIITSDKLNRQKGIINLRDISELLDSKKYRNEREKLYIIDIMNSFELSYKFPGNKNDYFVVPGSFSKDRPSFIWNPDSKPSLCFSYFYDILPSSIITRFMVRMHRKIRKRDYWRNGIVLTLNGCDALVIADNIEKSISIEVIESRKKTQWNNQRVVLGIIRHTLEDIHSQFDGLSITRKIPVDDGNKTLVSYDNLLKYEEGGETEIFIPDLMKKVSVTELLFGVDSSKDEPNSVNQSVEIRFDEINIKIVKAWISKGEFNRVFSKLIDYFEKRDSETTNDLYGLFSQFNILNKRHFYGDISYEKYSIKLNKIVSSLLMIIDKIPSVYSKQNISEEKEKAFTDKKKGRKKEILERKLDFLRQEIELIPNSPEKVDLALEIEMIEKEIRKLVEKPE